MVYLKKKPKKRVTIEQLKHQASKALMKVAKVVKGLMIQRLVRRIATHNEQQEPLTETDSLVTKLRALKELSHTLVGERLARMVFGEYVPPLEAGAHQEIDKEFNKDKRVQESKAEWINRLKDANSALARQARGRQAEQQAVERRAGIR